MGNKSSSPAQEEKSPAQEEKKSNFDTNGLSGYELDQASRIRNRKIDTAKKQENLEGLDTKNLSKSQLDEVALKMRSEYSEDFNYDNFNDVINDLKKGVLYIDTVNRYIDEYIEREKRRKDYNNQIVSEFIKDFKNSSDEDIYSGLNMLDEDDRDEVMKRNRKFLDISGRGEQYS